MKNGNQDLSSFLTNCSQAFDEFQKLQMNAVREMTELQLKFMNLCMECNSTQLQRLSRAETPSDVVATESGVATEYMNKFSTNAQQTFDTISKLQDEMFAWMQENPLLAQSESDASSSSKTKSKSTSAATH